MVVEGNVIRFTALGKAMAGALGLVGWNLAQTHSNSSTPLAALRQLSRAS